MLLAFMISCGEKENSITGNVSNLTTGEAISDVVVEFYYSEVSSSGSYNPNFKLFGSTKTDNSGNYSFEFDNKLFVDLKLKFIKEEYHIIDMEFEPEDKNSSYTKNVKLPIESYLNVKVRKFSGSNGDNLILRILGINPECLICCDDEQRNYYGNTINESFICPVVGGDVLHFEVLCGAYQEEEDIYCTPGDTVLYEIYL
jgi:hypothetical protein